MRAVIRSSITVDQTSLPPILLRRIISELSPRNPDKERALSEKIRGASKWEDEICLWRQEGYEIILPRGFAHRLEQLASDVGEEIKWESRMVLAPLSEHCFRDWTPFELRDYQTPARDAMLDWAQGIVQQPTGSGKTVVALEFARWAGQKTLVIVGKTALARQWQEAVRERYGYESGYIGESEWDEKDFTVALWQTLWSRRTKFEASAEDWGCVIFDEVHHCAADSLATLSSYFPAFYRIGISATPRWDPLIFPVIEAVVGPIIYRTTHDEVGENLVRPSVRIIESDFAAEYFPTRMEGRKRIQNNYGSIMTELVENDDRNDLIARIAREEAQEGHHVLIVTRRIEHVRQLVARLEKTIPVGSRLNTLTGAQTGADAQRIGRVIEKAEKGTILISTVADEALDFPRLDRIILAFPLRRIPLVEQQIGRIVRPYTGKEDALVYDITDPKIGVLRSQKKDRAQFYARRRWTVERLEREEIQC